MLVVRREGKDVRKYVGRSYICFLIGTPRPKTLDPRIRSEAPSPIFLEAL